MSLKPELIFAKLRKGKSGRFRVLKAGEEIQEGDISFGLTFCEFLDREFAGDKVCDDEAIIRLEFDE